MRTNKINQLNLYNKRHIALAKHIGTFPKYIKEQEKGHFIFEGKNFRVSTYKEVIKHPELHSDAPDVPYVDNFYIYEY